jgi:hypothetical protein
MKFVMMFLLFLFVGCGSAISKKEAAEGLGAMIASSVNISINSIEAEALSIEATDDCKDCGTLRGSLISTDPAIIKLEYTAYKQSIMCGDKIATTQIDGTIQYTWSYNDKVNTDFTLTYSGTLMFNATNCAITANVQYNRPNKSYTFTGQICGFTAEEINGYLKDNNCYNK